MEPLKPDWYSRLERGPFQRKKFTPGTMQVVEEKIKKRTPRRMRSYWYLGTGFAAVALLLILALPQAGTWVADPTPIEAPPIAAPGQNVTIPPNATAAPEREPYLFDPHLVLEGDGIGGMKVAAIARETFGKNSISVTFNGTKELSGTFSYTSPHISPYNPNQIIFMLDPPSGKQLPYPANKRFPQIVVLKASTEDTRKFGEPGRTGRATIRIADYTVVSAEILEGVSDGMTVEEVKSISLDPISPLPEMKAELALSLKPFNHLQPDGEQLYADDAAKVYPWMMSIYNTYNESISLLGEKIKDQTVAPSVMTSVGNWLSSVMTVELAIKQREEHFFPLLGGYQFMPGILNLFPPIVIERTEQPTLTRQDESILLYSVKLIATGTKDYELKCTLERGRDGTWRIQSIHHTPI